MELPKFRGQGTTSMDSARVTAARMTAPQKIRARTQDYKPMQSVQGAYSEAMQPTGLDNLLSIGGKILDYAIQIDNANQDMGVKAAQAEYKNHMSAWQTSFESTAMEQNEETGEANWKSYEEEAAKAREQTKSIMREKYKFGGKQREMEWKLSTDGIDTSLSNRAIQFTSKHKTAEAETNYKIASSNATSIQELDALNEQAVKDGVIYEAQAKETRKNFLVKQEYTGLLVGIQSSSPQAALAIANEMEMGTSARSKNYSVDARNKLVRESRERIENYHRANLADHYDREGSAGMRKYIDSLVAGGPESSMTGDYIQHDSMLSKLTTRFNAMKTAEKQNVKDMTNHNLVELALSGNKVAGDYLNASNVDNSDAKKQLSQVSVEVFGNNPYTTEGLQHINNQLQSGYINDYTKQVLSGDLKSNDPVRAGNALQVFEGFEQNFSAPATQEMLKSSGAQEKYNFYKAMKRSGLINMSDPDAVNKLNKHWQDVNSMGKKEYDRLRNTARSSLKEYGGSKKVFEEGMSKLKVTNGQTTESILDLWGVAADDDISATPWIEQSFVSAYEHTYALSGSHEAASMAGAEAITTNYGFSTSYDPNGDPIAEMKSPELMLGGQGHVGPVGRPSPFINAQTQAMVADANVILSGEYTKSDGSRYEPIDLTTSRRVYGGIDKADGQHYWLMYDANGELIQLPGNEYDGTQAGPLMLKYETVDPVQRKQEVDMNDMNTIQGVDSGYMALLGDRNIEMPAPSVKSRVGRSWYGTNFDTDWNNDIKGSSSNPDGWYGTGQSVMDITHDNADVWSNMSAKEQEYETQKWYKGYNTLMQVLSEEHSLRYPNEPFNQNGADLRVRHHLNSRGLMHGNDQGRFVYPPSLNDQTFNDMVAQ